MQLAASLQRLERVGETGALCHWYVAERPALILGRAQKSATVNLAACDEKGIAVVNRASGGTAVLVGPDFLSLDVVLPPNHPLNISDVTETYHWLGETWRVALSSLGITAELISIAEAREQTLADRADAATKTQADLVRLACFGALSPYEVAVGGRKLVGLSQLRRKHGTLLQAGLHWHFDKTLMAELLVKQPEERVVMLEMLAVRVTAMNEVTTGTKQVGADVIIDAFEAALLDVYNIVITWDANL